jgi:hypothetical protein
MKGGNKHRRAASPAAGRVAARSAGFRGDGVADQAAAGGVRRVGRGQGIGRPVDDAMALRGGPVVGRVQQGTADLEHQQGGEKQADDRQKHADPGVQEGLTDMLVRLCTSTASPRLDWGDRAGEPASGATEMF